MIVYYSLFSNSIQIINSSFENNSIGWNNISIDSSEYFSPLDQKKYFVGQNGNFILANKITNENKLPIIFGKFNPDDYIFLQTELLNKIINLDLRD